jgi:hypothetical protein
MVSGLGSRTVSALGPAYRRRAVLPATVRRGTAHGHARRRIRNSLVRATPQATYPLSKDGDRSQGDTPWPAGICAAAPPAALGEPGRVGLCASAPLAAGATGCAAGAVRADVLRRLGSGTSRLGLRVVDHPPGDQGVLDLGGADQPGRASGRACGKRVRGMALCAVRPCHHSPECPCRHLHLRPPGRGLRA